MSSSIVYLRCAASVEPNDARAKWHRSGRGGAFTAFSGTSDRTCACVPRCLSWPRFQSRREASTPCRCYLREERLDQVAQHAFRVAPADQREHSVRTSSSGATSLTEKWLSMTCLAIDHPWWKSHFRCMAARYPGASARAFRCTHTESFIGPCALVSSCHHQS